MTSLRADRARPSPDREDDAAIRELLAMKPAPRGYEPVTRRTPARPDARSADALPDLILLDWMLPDASASSWRASCAPTRAPASCHHHADGATTRRQARRLRRRRRRLRDTAVSAAQLLAARCARCCAARAEATDDRSRSPACAWKPETSA
jgi:CheY-like chemotaxis protein